MYWHGLATVPALLFLPLMLLALGLMYRGARGWRTVGVLGFSLTAIAVSHSTSAVVAAAVVATALAIDALRWLVARRSLRSWWRDGIVRPTIAGVAVAAVGGAGVIAHLRAQAADLGNRLAIGSSSRTG